jgi:hypothetical protein
VVLFNNNVLVDYLAGLVNTKCLNPNSQNTFQLSDIVNLMDHEMSMGIVPILKKSAQEYFVYNVDMTITGSQSTFTFPPRAIGNAIRDVVLLDASGNEVALNNLMREYIKVQFPFNFVPSIWSFGQYMTGNEVNLYNSLIQSYSAYKLRFITERRPGALTLSTTCGQITAITGTGPYVLTLSYVDPTWTTSNLFDIINNFPPFQSLDDGQAVTAINTGSSQVTVATLPTTVTTGMWFCPQMMSCIPQIPYELFPLLTEMTIATLAQGLDMSQLLAASNAKIKMYIENSTALVRPRIQGSPRVIINKDSFGRLGFGGVGGGFR